MMTSLTTFEQEFRNRLINVIYGQWRELGAAFLNEADPSEVIDPEALLWCSLEFFQSEPRLRECVLEWLSTRSFYLVSKRIKKRAKQEEPRSDLWINTLNNKRQTTKSFGRLNQAPSTLLLQARDLLGHDIRHFLLVYLLANPGGGKLRTIEKWSGYSYRSISDTAARWQDAGVVSVDHGFCKINQASPWKELLRGSVEDAVLVDWSGVFEASITLLRALAKALDKELSTEGSVVKAFRKDTIEVLDQSILNHAEKQSPTIEHLRQLL